MKKTNDHAETTKVEREKKKKKRKEYNIGNRDVNQNHTWTN